MKQIIAIQGYKNSGKNSVADMLQFLLNTPSWQHKYSWFRVFGKNNALSGNKYQQVSYAGRLKEVAGVILGVPVEMFENREFKENCYVDFTTLSLIWKDDITDDSKILSDTKFSKEVKRLDKRLAREYYLSVRQVLQYLGTEVMRHYLGDDLWILSALKSEHDKIIIPDQRFINEHCKSKENGAIVVHVTRPGCVAGTHASELELRTLEEEQMYDYLIKNNGTLKDLFNYCKWVVNKMKNA